jgi:hypothetical protein
MPELTPNERRMRERMRAAGLVPYDAEEDKPTSNPHTTYKESNMPGVRSVRGGRVTAEHDGQYGGDPW